MHLNSGFIDDFLDSHSQIKSCANYERDFVKAKLFTNLYSSCIFQARKLCIKKSKIYCNNISIGFAVAYTETGENPGNRTDDGCLFYFHIAVRARSGIWCICISQSQMLLQCSRCAISRMTSFRQSKGIQVGAWIICSGCIFIANMSLTLVRRLHYISILTICCRLPAPKTRWFHILSSVNKCFK